MQRYIKGNRTLSAIAKHKHIYEAHVLKHYNNTADRTLFTPFPCPFLAKLHSCLFIYFTSVLASIPAGTEV